MIIQLSDFAEMSGGTPGNVEQFVSNQRFFHDRRFAVPDTVANPGIARHDTRGRYILTFSMNPTMRLDRGFALLNFRLVNGNFVDISGIGDPPQGGISVASGADIDVVCNDLTVGNPIHILFAVDGQWQLLFGKNGTFGGAADVVFDYIGLIRVSEPGFAEGNAANLVLPRFVVSPQHGYEPLANAQRGSVGQPFGRTVRQLRTLRVNFTRIRAEPVEGYYRRVSITEPHFVVPYPESLRVPPMWATLIEPPRFTKRSENGWYWNCSLSWREAY